MKPARRKALFEDILRSHGPALQRLCAGYERVEARREELHQEILANLWQALPGFREQASLRTWMYRVAHNVATRHASKESRQPKGEAPSPTLDDASPSAAAQLERGQALQRLRVLISELKPLDRQIILLHLEEVPQSEVAEITGLSTANVSTRVHRIKGRLAKGMKR